MERYHERGYATLPGLFKAEELTLALSAIHSLFWGQLALEGIHPTPGRDPEGDLHDALQGLYRAKPATFLSALNQAPNLPALVRLGSTPKVLSALQGLGLGEPILATPPICYFLSEAFKLPGGHHRAPPHQDWRYIQGSLDALTLWLPLVAVEEGNGTIEVIPGSHLGGLRPTTSALRDLSIAKGSYDDQGFVPINASPGDGVVFSAFTVHRSGINCSGRVRWALAFRFNNLQEPSFRARGMPSPYRFTPELDLKKPGWPTQEDLAPLFGHPKN